ncbi:MAG: ribonuclease R [Oscillospiraceae bacterium]|jgi:ribonuclease R
MDYIDEKILALFGGEACVSLTQRALTEYFGGEFEPGLVLRRLAGLESEGRLIRVKKNAYALPIFNGLVAGTFSDSGRGFGFVTPDGGGADYFIPPRRTLDAWDGDRVMIRPEESVLEDGRQAAASVERIIRRSGEIVTGRIERSKRKAVLIPRNSRLPSDIEVSLSALGDARDNDMAAIRITDFGDGHKSPPSGRVIEVLGRADDWRASVEAALYEAGVHESFGKKTMAEAAAVPFELPDISARLDLRDRFIFTIDGEDAKDLDDAVSIEKLPGGWRLGVHIADVSHYVRDGSALDKEAFYRGTSIYFADRVIPMLPGALSNGICSLNPNVPRLTLSAFISFGPDGEPMDYSLHESVIKSSFRMSYSVCNRLLDGTAGELSPRYTAVTSALTEMKRLADILSSRRASRGAQEFETTEGHILCDETGEPVNVVPRERGASERIIEEFMIAANECVARHMEKRRLPALYRVHEKPSPEKLEVFRKAAALYGLDVGDGIDTSRLRKALKSAEGRPYEPVLSALLLRAQKKARYSVENIGHYGLASDCYCHFTSPIRRYPDLMVHRVLKLSFKGTVPRSVFIKAAEAAQQSSMREVIAENLERDVEKFYKARIMESKIGREFDAVISGVHRFGIFVMLPDTVEGLVPIESLPGNSFEVDESGITLTGAGVSYTLGMPLRVRCTAASAVSGLVDFELAD